MDCKHDMEWIPLSVPQRNADHALKTSNMVQKKISTREKTRICTVEHTPRGIRPGYRNHIMESVDFYHKKDANDTKPLSLEVLEMTQ